MFCAQCGTPTIPNTKFCSKCGTVLDNTNLRANPNENTLQVTEVFPATPSVAVHHIRPWVRFWARMFDLSMFNLLAILLISIVAPDFFSQNGGETLRGMGMLFLWVFIEALLLSSFGTTPGKWFFKIKLALASGEPITYSQAISRSMKVFLNGLGAGFPIISLVTLIMSLKQLNRNNVTLWDRDGNYVVTHGEIGVPRVLTAIGYFIVVFAIVAAPKYQQTYQLYVTKARMAEAATVGTNAAESVANYYYQYRQIPNSLALAGFIAPLPPSIKEISINAQTGVVTLTMENTPMEGKTLLFVPSTDANNRINWTCTSQEIPDNYLPNQCRQSK